MGDTFSKGNIVRWLGLFALYTILLWVTIAGSIAWILVINLRINQILNMLIFSAAISLIICAFGFFKARVIFWLSTAGAVIGTIAMIILFSTNGREDSVMPLIVLLMSFIAGLILGIAVQLMIHWIGKLRSRE